jgi:hypothetical protein
MVPGSPRTRFTDPALIRLLAQLAQLDAGGAQPAFAERLGQWLHWTDATALLAALDDAPAVPASAWHPEAADAQARELARVRNALVTGITQDCALTPAPQRAPGPRGPALTQPAPPEEPLDFATLRRRYANRQQAMTAAIEPLRAQLRAALAGASADLARLAALDAVMERVLGPRERALLGAVPVLLEKHFDHLRQAPAAAGWLDTFGQRMQAVLLAELDVRLQPAEGLLAALNGTRHPSHHDA